MRNSLYTFFKVKTIGWKKWKFCKPSFIMINSLHTYFKVKTIGWQTKWKLCKLYIPHDNLTSYLFQGHNNRLKKWKFCKLYISHVKITSYPFQGQNNRLKNKMEIMQTVHSPWENHFITYFKVKTIGWKKTTTKHCSSRGWDDITHSCCKLSL